MSNIPWCHHRLLTCVPQHSTASAWCEFAHICELVQAPSDCLFICSFMQKPLLSIDLWLLGSCLKFHRCSLIYMSNLCQVLSEELADCLSKKLSCESCEFSENMWGKLPSLLAASVLALINIGRCLNVGGSAWLKT